MAFEHKTGNSKYTGRKRQGNVISSHVLLRKNRFKLVKCQLETLRKCRNIHAVKIALSRLPRTLDDTYDHILNNIDEEDRRVAHYALQLIAFSYRPLTIVEVAEATIVNVEDKTIDDDLRVLDKYDILEICSSFIELYVRVELISKI